ncbi:hypothetical protein L3Q82_000931 [Scortum barcoo]|uniref:Uncharacterized protein n=1 Tax=Scortum barcoo TaxID=214431 RepID=A0ACB8WAX7_9TELE|nr:hypothetical protein L3Q82_000931 [Scortum barcoo]
MFYQSVVASVLFYTVVCWGGSISKKDTSRLDKLIRRAGSVVGTKLDSLVTVAESRTRGLWTNCWILWTMPASHPLHTVISNQRSLFSERLLLPKCRTNRLKNSFVHHAITLYNSSQGGGGHSHKLPWLLRSLIEGWDIKESHSRAPEVIICRDEQMPSFVGDESESEVVVVTDRMQVHYRGVKCYQEELLKPLFDSELKLVCGGFPVHYQ